MKLKKRLRNTGHLYRDSLIAGLAITVLMVSVLYLVDVFDFLPGGLKAAITNVAGLLFALGAVSLITDARLRDSISDDVIEKAGIGQNLAAAGIESVDLDHEVDWEEIVESADRLTCIVADPDTWHGREWARIREAARTRSIEIRVFFPESPIPPAPNAAIDAPTPEGAAKDLEDEWQDLLSRGAVQSGARLEIRRPRVGTAFSLAMTRAWIVLVAHGSVPDRSRRPPVSFRIRRIPGSTPDSWASMVVEELEAVSPPAYARTAE